MPMMRWAFVVLRLLLLLLYGVATAAFSSSSSSPTHRCTFEGFYDAGVATSDPCPGALPCDPGFFCTGGARQPCPAGTYGAESQLRSSACSAVCPAGFYCPKGAVAPIPCGGDDVYCPLRSSAPVQVPEGFYATGVSALRRDRIAPCPLGMFCSSGTRRPCPAGTYGATLKLTTPQCIAPCPAGFYCPLQSVEPIPCPGGTFGDRVGLETAQCAGLCREGFFCPQGSISSTQQPCGPGAFCPAGSERPLHADAGAFVINGGSRRARKQVECPKGSFCRGDDGVAVLCPGGTYGNVEGLNAPKCAGDCVEGFFCPRGSTSTTQNECGGAHMYCPKGSSKPLPVAEGFYTIGKLSLDTQNQPVDDATTRSDQRRCEPGHFCISGERFPCPAGTFGGRFGLTTPQCSGPCLEGHYCPERSIVGSAFPCGSSDFFCPEGSGTPTRVSQGFCTIGSAEDAFTRTDQRLALPGEFAWKGTCFQCPAGTFGSSSGEVSSRCSGVCAPGYYCPPGSTSPMEKECGGPDKYCPQGLGAPLDVHIGYYTSIDGTQVDNQCPPGMYRDFGGTTVNNFIDLLTGRSPISVSYGDSRFPLAACVNCPLGTFKAVTGDDPALCVLCPEFTTVSTVDRRSCECFRLAGGLPYEATSFKLRFDVDTLSCNQLPLDSVQLAPAEANNSVFTRFKQFPCERGYYCQSGIRYPCPGGRFGSSAMETSGTCTGLCTPGFFCPLTSTNSTARVCGNANVHCPAGSAVPMPVLPGYYSIRTSLIAHSLVMPSSQDLVKASLPAGVVQYEARNATVNEAIRDAQAQCEAGYYCVNGRKFICPAGRYGDQLGETSSSSECGGSNVMCRTGSSLPALVPPGYYSVGGTNATRFYQRPCETGYFCVGGVKYQCPEGTFGGASGLQDPKCSGKCSPGYYCPSYPHPPSVSSTQSECGNSTVYCPEGTGNTPALVQSGYYTVGAGDGSGDVRNSTRIAQQICPKGHYCRRGIVIRCPEGTYGDEEGLSDTFCKGWCPSGFACPRGTANYRANPCPHRTYAPKGSAFCIECPPVTDAHLSTVLSIFNIVSEGQEQRPCTDKRECCFFG